jgi:hypothetical protein
VEREHRHLDRKPMKRPAKITSWVLCVMPEVRWRCTHREALAAGLEEQREKLSNEGRTEQREEEELDRRVLTLLPAPDTDHEVHRQQHDLEEHEEEDEVLRDERAVHADLEHQDRRRRP